MKPCPYCAEDIQDAAIVCKHCGRALATGTRETVVMTTAPPAPRTSAAAAAVLSVFVPGLGSMVNRQVLAGVVFLLFTLVGYGMYIVPGLLVHVGAVVHAYKLGSKPTA